MSSHFNNRSVELKVSFATIKTEIAFRKICHLDNLDFTIPLF